ncbi:MAG: hypothetical protein ACJ741_04295 [Pyrinomonadaceae bacterium]
MTVKSLSLIVVLLLWPCACGAGAARAQRTIGDADAGFEYGTLAEIRDKRNMLLVAGRSFAVDARTPSSISAEDVRHALAEARRQTNLHAFRVVADKLNKYIVKYQSMTSVETREEADFLVVFKVMQERHSHVSDLTYSYGKLFVVVPGTHAGDKPRVVWESKGEMTLVEDAAGDLIKALKEARGEK